MMVWSAIVLVLAAEAGETGAVPLLLLCKSPISR